MSKFVLHPEAYSDLNEIWEYIAADNLDAADRVLEEIYQAITSLVRFPGTGHSRPDLTSTPLRFLAGFLELRESSSVYVECNPR